MVPSRDERQHYPASGGMRAAGSARSIRRANPNISNATTTTGSQMEEGETCGFMAAPNYAPFLSNIREA